MPSALAALLFVMGLSFLFYLVREPEIKTSPALWLPVFWALIIGSRPVSTWLGMGPTTLTAENYLDGSPLDRMIFICLIGAAMAVLLTRLFPVGAVLRNNKAILLFFAYCAVSVVWSDYSSVSFKRWIKAIGDLAMILIVWTDLHPTIALKRLLTRAGFILIPASVLLAKFYPMIGRMYNRWTYQPSYIGVTTTKNELGMSCLVFGLGILWAFVDSYRDKENAHRWSRIFAYGLVLAMTAWLLLKADSVTSLYCFTFAGGMMIATGRFKFARKPMIINVMVVGVVSALAIFLFTSLGTDIIVMIGRDPTLTGRTDIWDAVVQFVPNHLIGTGYGSFWLGPRLMKIRDLFAGNPLMEAHNGYLEIFLTLGWLGIGLLAILILNGFQNVKKLMRDNPDLASLKLALFLVGVVYNFSESAFKELNTVWFFFLLAILWVPDSAAVPMAVPADDHLFEASRQLRPALATEPAGYLQHTSRPRLVEKAEDRASASDSWPASSYLSAKRSPRT